MAVNQQVTPETAELFGFLSPSSKAALSVAEAARGLTDENAIEIAHLLYGLYQKDSGPTRGAFNAASINNENLRDALGLTRLDPTAVRRKTTELTAMPGLAPHSQKAIEEANRIRLQRGDNQIRSRHLLAGSLSVTECSLVRELLTEHRVSFDLDAFEKQEKEREEQKAAPRVAVAGDPIRIATVGETEIFLQETGTPLRLPVDAFGLFVDKDYPQNILPNESLRSELSEERWSQLQETISSSESRFETSPWGFSVGVVDTPSALVASGLPSHFIVARARDYTSLVACAKAIIWRAAKERLSKIALPLNPRTGASLGTEDAQLETIKFLLLEREFGRLTSITLTTRESGQAEELARQARESEERWFWESISTHARNVFEWAAAVAGRHNARPGEGPGVQREISALQLLSGLMFITDDGKRPAISEFLLDLLGSGLPSQPDIEETDAVARLVSLFQVPPTVSPETLSNFPAMEPDCRRALEIGLRIKPLGRSGVHARDLTAALLLRTEPSRDAIVARELSDLGLELSNPSQRFLSYIERQFPNELEHWKAVLSRGLELVMPSRATMDNDEVRGKIKAEDDLLNVNQEVDRFARLLVASDVKPPISLGLFGNWGSGKSFFMGLLKTRIEELSSDNTYVANVAQIDFNAWHYVDTNLWASLAVRIFDGLARELGFDTKTDIDEARKALHREIHSSKRGREQAVQQQEAAKEKRADAGEELQKLQTTRAKVASDKLSKRLLRVWNAARTDPQFNDEKKEIDKIAKQLGLSTALTSAQDASRLIEELRSIGRQSGGLAAAVSARFRDSKTAVISITAIILVVAAAVGFGFVVESLRESSDWIRQTIPQASAGIVQVATILSTGAAWASRRVASVSQGLRKLETLQQKFQNLEATTPLSEDEQKIQKQIDEYDAEIQRINESISEADRRIAVAEAELQRIDQGGLVYDFLKDRKQSSRYLDQLGLISTIRGDFERLGELLEDLRKNGKKPIDRIILYIDDLDRCQPDQVVEVLQAVHLILAFDLFSVVVGVDARWLERSLYRTYVGRTSAGAGVAGSRAGTQAFSPQNYLEKIFQIPYSLQDMTETGFKQLVGKLITSRTDYQRLAEAEQQRKREEEQRKRIEESKEESRLKLRKDEPGEEVLINKSDNQETNGLKGQSESNANGKADEESSSEQIQADKGTQQQADAAEQKEAIDALFLEDWEEDYLQLLYAFIPTPRLVKRFVNVYRLLRVTATQTDFNRFVGNKSRGDYQAALVLLAINIGYPTIGGQLLKLLCRRPARGTWNDFLKQIDPDTEVTDREDWAKPIQWSHEQQREFRTIKKHLKKLQDERGTIESLDSYIRWSNEVGRYSFQWHISADET
jgi:hypothetical protein